jgi:hypothetical protein
MEDDGNVALISPVGTDTSTSPKSERAHIKYLKFFDYASFIVTPELRAMHEYLSHRMWGVEQLLDIRCVDQQWQIKVLWEDAERTWELMADMMMSVPELVEVFLDQGYPKHAKSRRDNYIKSLRTVGGVRTRPTPRLLVRATTPVANGGRSIIH